VVDVIWYDYDYLAAVGASGDSLVAGATVAKTASKSVGCCRIAGLTPKHKTVHYF